MGELISFARVRRAVGRTQKSPAVPPTAEPLTCPACGDPITSMRDSMMDEDERVHVGCALKTLRHEMWLTERYGMRHALRMPLSTALGRKHVEELIEPLGDRKRKPSQVFAALNELTQMLRNSTMDPLLLASAHAAVNTCRNNLRSFLGRHP